MHLVAVLQGYQDADDDAEKLCLTFLLFESVLCKLAVVSGEPALSVGWVTSMWSPPRSLAC